jgi:flagellar biogenesis protein FliO
MDIVRQSLAVVFVLASLWAALCLVRKKGWRIKAPAGLVESRGKLTLTARHSVHLIRIGERNLILALHPGGVTFLGDALEASGPRKDIGAGGTV